ncbi:hypothetical protein EXIGLDRAFT_275167 [Exidia glandulosa HHB12029]|uniref:phytol kinase n=1 Tax=Exidia glandulosa HHB12029 TaxID=1314781 RepID=A0A165M867_EXIGL|nr:hypothetical protein EXIGLDRAFT_275167 [Exidia glandulosa HHB12029]
MSFRASSFTLERALALASAMCDVQQPTACPICVATLAPVLHPYDKTTKLPLLEQLRDEHPEFWDACITFLTTPRTDAELHPLRSVLLQNVRDCSYRWQHHTRQNSGATDLIHIMIESLCVILHSCIGNGKHNILSRPGKHPSSFGGKRGRWPSHFSQLFPYGEERAVDAHLFWITKRFSIAPVRLFGAILAIARPHTFPHLVVEPAHGKLVYVLAQMLHGNVGAVPEGWDDNPAIFPAADASLPLAAPSQEMEQIEAAIFFLHIVRDGMDGSGADEQWTFAKPFDLVLFHAINTAASKIEDDHPCLATLTTYALLRIKRGDMPITAVHPRVRAVLDHSARRPRVELADVIRLHLTQLTKRRICCGPNCSNTALIMGHALSLCSRCKITRYCGPECQRLDWTSGSEGIRHKEVCPLVCRFLEVSPLDTADYRCNALCNQSLDLQERRTLARWAMTSGAILSTERMKEKPDTKSVFSLI